MNEAKDYDLIITLFDKFLKHKTTKTITDMGFRKYLLKEQIFPAWLVKNLMRQINYDPNLSYHIRSYTESYLIEGMLLGTLKDSAVKLILKNKFGYEENPVKTIDDRTQTVRTITMRTATPADAEKLKLEEAG